MKIRGKKTPALKKKWRLWKTEGCTHHRVKHLLGELRRRGAVALFLLLLTGCGKTYKLIEDTLSGSGEVLHSITNTLPQPTSSSTTTTTTTQPPIPAPVTTTTVPNWPAPDIRWIPGGKITPDPVKAWWADKTIVFNYDHEHLIRRLLIFTNANDAIANSLAIDECEETPTGWKHTKPMSAFPDPSYIVPYAEEQFWNETEPTLRKKSPSAIRKGDHR